VKSAVRDNTVHSTVRVLDFSVYFVWKSKATEPSFTRTCVVQ
jgi:hypothetical protein